MPIGVPTSMLMRRATSACLASSPAAIPASHAARSPGAVSLQPVSKAARAAATARSTSAAAPMAMRPITSSVEAERTSSTPGEDGACQRPSM